MSSTAGQGADSPLGQLRARALAQPHVTRRGAVTHAKGADLRLLEWACSEDDDVDAIVALCMALERAEAEPPKRTRYLGLL